MHLAEGMLPLEHAIGWSVVGTGMLTWSIRGEKQLHQDLASPSVLMSGVTSLLFAATLLPLPVPVVGATSHICLTPILALIIGVRRIIWPTFFVLLLQAIFFAHGGLTTLGLNTVVLGFFGPLVTIGLWRLMQKFGIASILGLAIACGMGDLFIYVVDAIVLAVALADLADPITTFTSMVLGFAPVQIPLAVLEVTASVGIVRLLAVRREDFLPASLKALKKVPASILNTAIFLLTFNLSGCNYEGIDGTVFGATAESVGRMPKKSLIDLSQGELGLTMSILILFGLGFIAGRCWERIFSGGHNELPR